MISADTSVVVRYLVGSPAGQARRAARLIDRSDAVALSVVVLIETAHVLRTQYGVARPAVIQALLELVRRENVVILGLSIDDATDALVRARAMPGRPIPDALITAMARAAGAVPIYTFDRTMARYGVPVAEP